MLSLEWHTFKPLDTQKLSDVKQQFHLALQNVAAVGRKFLKHSDNDENATLTWIPGLSRLAGKWIEGSVRFRSSISFEDFAIYLVDERVNTISSFSVVGKTHRQIMIWLEEQIGKLQLTASDLTLNLPYKIQDSPQLNGEKFQAHDPDVVMELMKYYHNTFKVLRAFKKSRNINSEVYVWPHHFDEALTVLIKDTGDPETNSTITLGMSPGDESIAEPYFYVSTWPHVLTSQFPMLKNGAIWVEEEWTGSVFLSSEIIKKKNQEEAIVNYFEDAYHLLVQSLKD